VRTQQEQQEQNAAKFTRPTKTEGRHTSKLLHQLTNYSNVNIQSHILIVVRDAVNKLTAKSTGIETAVIAQLIQERTYTRARVINYIRQYRL
jgi:hypothetical protein